jgi:hypothetical protein
VEREIVANGGSGFMSKRHVPICHMFSLILRGILTIGLGISLASCSRETPQVISYGTSLLPTNEYERVGIPTDSYYPQFGEALEYHGKTYTLDNFSDVRGDKFDSRTELPVAGIETKIGYRRGITLSPSKYMIVGGVDLGGACTISNTWILDTISGKISEGPKMHEARCRPNLRKLSNGQILISGGQNWDIHTPIDSIEIYDPTSNTMKYIGRMHKPRDSHSVCELSDGRILIVGGKTSLSKADAFRDLTSIIEILDLKTNTIKLAGQLHDARFDAVVIPLDNNHALICAGSDEHEVNLSGDWASVLSVELFAPRF